MQARKFAPGPADGPLPPYPYVGSNRVRATMRGLMPDASIGERGVNACRVYLIDPPSAFATANEWRAFVQELESLQLSDSPEVHDALAVARAMLADRMR